MDAEGPPDVAFLLPAPFEPIPLRDRFLTEGEVRRVVGLSKTTITGLIKRGEFPQRVLLSEKCARWHGAEILDWQSAQLAARPAPPQEGAAA